MNASSDFFEGLDALLTDIKWLLAQPLDDDEEWADYVAWLGECSDD